MRINNDRTVYNFTSFKMSGINLLSKQNKMLGLFTVNGNIIQHISCITTSFTLDIHACRKQALLDSKLKVQINVKGPQQVQESIL